MNSFPMNALPTEFEEAHGSTDLADTKPLVEDDVEDMDLGLHDVGQRVWLVKVPKFLMEKWSEVQEEGVILGRVRVYDEKDSYGDPKIAVILDESPTASGSSTPSSSSTKPDVKGKGAEVLRSKRVPTEYKLTLQNTASKNMFVFGEKEEEDEDSGEVGARKRRRITKMLGTVNHECALTPSLSSIDARTSYQALMRERQRKATEPKRTLRRLDVDQGTANMLASGMGLAGVRGRVSTFVKAKPVASSSDNRAARIPRNELLDMLFGLFETAPYWKLKDLTSHVKQPQAYLKEVLSDIAKLVARGPYLGMYTLTDQYKVGGVKPEVKSEVALRPGEVKPEELDDNEDDEEMVEVVG